MFAPRNTLLKNSLTSHSSLQCCGSSSHSLCFSNPVLLSFLYPVAVLLPCQSFRFFEHIPDLVPSSTTCQLFLLQWRASAESNRQTTMTQVTHRLTGVYCRFYVLVCTENNNTPIFIATAAVVHSQWAITDFPTS